MAANADPKVFEVEEEIEGDHIESTDYYFDKIGGDVPLKVEESPFNLEEPPVQPLAVSEREGLIFTAHSSGFFVARTKDIINAAKENKDKGGGCSIEDRSVLNVCIGRVNILALSADSSTLAACVGGNIQFFPVESLLAKSENSSFSCSLESSTVKDMRWTKSLRASFIILSKNGTLYRGELQKHLEIVMEDVDAVEWSRKGKFIAVARKNVLSILSSKLHEKWQIALPFKSWTDEVSSGSVVRVDSLRWVRSDCIVIGCLQQTADNKEENYLVQVVMSKDGTLTKPSSNPVVLSFSDMFLCMADDIMPFGCGPHLFMSYLEQSDFAVAANKKNTDEHIVLLRWSDEDNNVALVDICREKWLPRIGLQENGDDNLVLGLCLDQASLHENVKVMIGDEEWKELPPLCILMCLTLEGKLILYNVARTTESTSLPCASSVTSEEEESGSCEETFKLPATPGLEQKSGQSVSLLDSAIASGSEIGTNGVGLDNIIKPSIDNQILSGGRATGNFVGKNLLFRQTATSSSPILGGTDVSREFEYRPVEAQNSSVDEKRSFAGSKSGIDSSRGTSVLERSNISNYNTVETPFGIGTTIVGDMGSGSPLHGSPSLSLVAGHSDSKYPIYSSNVTGGIIGKASSHMLGPSNSVTNMPSSTREKISASNVMNKTIPSKSSLDIPSQDGPSKANQKPQNVSEQHGNITDMVKEMDKLLRCIEDDGGSKDTCISVHKFSLEALEERVRSVYGKSTMWQMVMNQRLGEIQLLLDKTVQVMARKTYMEGILKQTTDSQYWDFWNRQKLSSELEVKRKNISDLNQVLINQLIGLEKHFNALELHKFGESNQDSVNRRSVRSKCLPSRQVHSLHAVHNAMTSQLAAAEQLSECLSKQLGVLSIKSPPTKQENVKKQLFDSIGIPFDETFVRSPDVEATRTPVMKNSLFSPCPSLMGSENRRNQFGAANTHEPETARRRRDSLDRDWATYEPPKTTIKRTLTQNERRRISSPLSIDKRLTSASEPERVMVADRGQAIASSDGSALQDTLKKLASGSVSTSVSPWLKVPSATSQGSPITTPEVQILGTNKNVEGSTHPIDAPVPSTSCNVKSEPVLANEVKYALSAKSRFSQTQASFPGEPRLLTPALQNSSPMPIAPVNETIKLRDGVDKQTAPGSLVRSGNAHEAKSSLMFSVSSVASEPASLPPSSPVTSLVTSSSFHPLTAQTTVAKSSNVGPDARTGPSLGAEKANILGKSLAFPALSQLNSSFPEPSKDSNFPGVSSVSFAKGLGAEPQSPADKVTSETTPKPDLTAVGFNFDSLSASGPSIVGSTGQSPVLDASVSGTTPLACASSNPDSGNKPIVSSQSKVTSETHEKPDSVPTATGFKINSSGAFASSMVSVGQSAGTAASVSSTSTFVSGGSSNSVSEKQPSAFSMFSAPSSNVVGGAIDASAVQEDDMEEEASETGQAPDVNLGSLGGLGLGMGSAGGVTGTRLNPFGVSVVSTAATSSSSSMVVPNGGLFRPASFSFQSLQPSQQPQAPNVSAFSGGLNPATQPSSGGGFGQPAQLGSGQQALGSVLGSFGQSRQLGTGLPGSGFGGGFAGTQSPGGFGNAATGSSFGGASATGGGFAGVSGAGGGFGGLGPTSGGFAGLGTSGGFAGLGATSGGFGGAAAPGGGFTAAGAAPSGGFAAAGGFAGAASGGGGFGAFNGQGSGFSSFGSSAGAGGGRPPELFTQIRK